MVEKERVATQDRQRREFSPLPASATQSFSRKRTDSFFGPAKFVLRAQLDFASMGGSTGAFFSGVARPFRILPSSLPPRDERSVLLTRPIARRARSLPRLVEKLGPPRAVLESGAVHPLQDGQPLATRLVAPQRLHPLVRQGSPRHRDPVRARRRPRVVGFARRGGLVERQRPRVSVL